MEVSNTKIYTNGRAALRRILAANCPLTAAAWADFEDLLRPQFLAKGEYLCEEGAYPSDAAYLISGVARAFYRNQDGVEYNKTFFTAGSFPSPLAALILQAENYINLQCLADSYIFRISYPKLTALFARHRCLETFVRRMVELTWVEKELREINMVMKDASANYQLFRERFPELEGQIPQYHIASYLGITPIQLSRIRAKLAKG
ncbi:MAG: Crp/Fnr family transcriptional regulator [Phaeodactylibacter sp.]|nr:Crp/Fnr family transcriptional regulator [Phaeodactylibacter sp.]